MAQRRAASTAAVLVALLATLALQIPEASAWPQLFTERNDCESFVRVGDPQDRSHVIIGDWYHPPMIVLCDAVDSSVDRQWCLDNCDITGGMPPTGQTCSYDLCRCEEECICEDGSINNPRAPCPQCDHRINPPRPQMDNYKPLEARAGSVALFVNGKHVEHQQVVDAGGEGNSSDFAFLVEVARDEVEHGVMFKCDTETLSWFLVDATAGTIEPMSMADTSVGGAVTAQCNGRRLAFHEPAQHQVAIWSAPAEAKVAGFSFDLSVATASSMGDVELTKYRIRLV